MNKITRLLAGAALAMGLTTVGAFAQPLDVDILPDRGTSEISLAGTITLSSPRSTFVTGRYGYFLNRNSQIGGDITFFDFSGPGSLTFLEGFYNYHFSPIGTSGRTLPYVGVAAGIVTGSGTDLTTLGVQGGLKHFLNETVAVFGELNYRDVNKGVGDQTNLLFGISVYLR
jgi:hypothetical protein